MRPRGLFAFVLASLLVAGGAAVWYASFAAAIEHHPKTVADLETAAAEASATTTMEHRKIRILIVPGHEPGAGGAAYKDVRERDLVVRLSEDLRSLLQADGRYDVMLSRDENGWNPVLAHYFSTRWNEIDAWRMDALSEMEARISSGSITPPPAPVGHVAAAHAVAVRLYGITKWANEHDIDLMVHVHFDTDQRSTRTVGRRDGFAIFVPPPQYGNGAASRAVAEDVKERLAALDPIADLPGEGDGIVEDPKLIAVGENDTSDIPSMLIEYAFIYERQLRTPDVRRLALDDMAYRTFVGLNDYFFKGDNPASDASSTDILPRAWPKTVGASSDAADIFALQTALAVDGEYPPGGMTKSACPRNGSFGSCTRAALKAFQQKYGISGETGTAGPKTLSRLKALSF